MFISKLIIGGTIEKRSELVGMIVKKLTVSVYDLHTTTPSEKTNRTGIADIKSCIHDLSLTPVEGNVKACVFYELQTATREAQNALLKLVEEPDIYTAVFITADRKESILPTIVSRCQLVVLSNSQDELTVPPEIRTLHEILSASPGVKLYFAEQLAKDKQAAIQKLTGLVALLRDNLITSSKEENTKKSNDTLSKQIMRIRIFERARISLIKTNTNPRLLLENLLLESSV